MPPTTRRRFLQQASQVAAGLSLVGVHGATATARNIGPNDKLALGFIGVGGRGAGHLHNLGGREECQVVAVCDPHRERLAAARDWVKTESGQEPAAHEDLRELLDNPSLDAVVIATPDHWHAPAAIWACQAGKDVYVEKPVSNNAWEGRQMVAAARKYDRIVQAGTQNRSAAYNIAAKKYLDEGKLGRVELIRVFNQIPDANFPAAPSQAEPAWLNWNLWNGPAPEQPFNPTMYDHWHYFWRYSGGEVTDDGVHQFDLARWMAGVAYPKSVTAIGRPFPEAGAAETPSTMIVTYEFDELVLTFEQTLHAPYMVKIPPEVRNGDLFPYWWQTGTRIEIYGTKGLMLLGRHGGGWQVFVRTKDRLPVVVDQMYGRFPDREHHQNFIDCLRSRQRPNADIEEGHTSALLCHLANISHRVGNLQLQYDPKTERITNCEPANQLLKPEYRAPFVVPEHV
jgi:predicted dehydrogenase